MGDGQKVWYIFEIQRNMRHTRSFSWWGNVGTTHHQRYRSVEPTDGLPRGPPPAADASQIPLDPNDHPRSTPTPYTHSPSPHTHPIKTRCKPTRIPYAT